MTIRRRTKQLLRVGLDVGSTTVKAVVLSEDDELLWSEYRRHESKQVEQARLILERIETQFDTTDLLLTTTGSGGRALSEVLGATHVQEVNAVAHATETLLPDVQAVIELGGQDAKIILWNDANNGPRTSTSFMNDKCAGGTGATLDRIIAKIGLSETQARQIRSHGKNQHHVAAKCGVFAETDVIGLLKTGVDPAEILVSLCAAIVRQNLEVLLHGNVLRPPIALLGGPHTFVPALIDAWNEAIPKTWAAHDYFPADENIAEAPSAFVPKNSQYFAAIGSILFAGAARFFGNNQEATSTPIIYRGSQALQDLLSAQRDNLVLASGACRDGLVSSDEERAQFEQEYAWQEPRPTQLTPGQSVDVHLGIDGGSTSSKLVLINSDGDVIYKQYLLSEGNPITDIKKMMSDLHNWQHEQKIDLVIQSTGVTGYASNILKRAFQLDVGIVETVAHMKAAKQYYGEVDVICDVGGQDIKVLFLKHGRVVDVRLNTQCSAGNGYFLQSMANQFGIAVEDFSAHAFSVRRAPCFNYGCAVFMEQDKVNFQQLGFSHSEIMAGLAAVLPLNIWNYVVQEPSLARFGNRFLLQGGTQKNLAAVKAQVDYIKNRVPNAAVIRHKYADICGAIGAAMAARDEGLADPSRFIGLEAASAIEFQTRCDESTRCTFCSNRCPRTFIDIKPMDGQSVRHISGHQCDKGTNETVFDVRAGEHKRRQRLAECPNLVSKSAELVFSNYEFDPIPKAGEVVDFGFDPLSKTWEARRSPKKRPFQRSTESDALLRSKMCVGIPRLLNLYYSAPFFSTYLRCLGVGNVLFSPPTSGRLWDEGNKFGAIDPCFPAKVAPAHVYNLINHRDVTHICFPMITQLESDLQNTMGNHACVIQMGTPEVVEAAFTRNKNHFEATNIEYWKPLVRMDRPAETAGRLFEYFGPRLRITSHENSWAVSQGFRAMSDYLTRMRTQGRHILDDLVRHGTMGILFVGHPYHHDPGINHGLLEQFQLRGYPILCIESLPTDEEFLGPLFHSETQPPMDIADVWPRNFNRNTNLKIWATKVAARHPHLAVIDISSFKCGHDAPTYSYVDSILDASFTPHFLFHDLDQNKPSATFDIRIESIDYFLRLERKRLEAHLEETGS